MELRSNLRKRFRSAFRLVRGKKKEEAPREMETPREKKSFKERLLGLSRRIRRKNND